MPEEPSNERQVRWTFTCSAAPVQAEGTIDGMAFYFRSRHDEWTFGVSSERQPDPVLVDSPEDGFFRHGEDMNASYMPLEEATAIIERCIVEYNDLRISPPPPS